MGYDVVDLAPPSARGGVGLELSTRAFHLNWTGGCGGVTEKAFLRREKE